MIKAPHCLWHVPQKNWSVSELGADSLCTRMALIGPLLLLGAGAFFELLRDNSDTSSEALKEQLATYVNDFVDAHKGVGDNFMQALGRSLTMKTSNKLFRLPDKVCMCLACVMSA